MGFVCGLLGPHFLLSHSSSSGVDSSTFMTTFSVAEGLFFSAEHHLLREGVFVGIPIKRKQDFKRAPGKAEIET